MYSWSVIYSEVYVSQLLRPPGLPSVERFGSCEVFQVVVIREYLYLVLRPFTISAPVLECVNDCEKFLVVDFVIDLRG